MLDPYKTSSEIVMDNPEAVAIFAKEFLGIDLYVHKGQLEWSRKSHKVINILRPANQWGKTAITAIKHVYHAVRKARLDNRVVDVETWKKIRYETINVGKTYEVARGVLEAAVDMTEGTFLLPSGETNKSLLAGWAIEKVMEQQNKPPEIHWWNGSRTLIRSYDDLGSAFKRKKLAYVSSDECGDIPELTLFLTGTLLPRLQFYRGSVDLIGTPQSSGVEYEEIAEKAKSEWENEVETGQTSEYYFQTGSVYENPNLSADFIRKIESVADEKLRRQIIYGEYVDWGDHIYTHEEVNNMFTDLIPYDEASGMSEPPESSGKYVFVVDMAASSDETSVTCIRYDIKVTGPDGKRFESPYRIVFHKAFKGETIPLTMQYELIKSWYYAYKNVAQFTKFVYDSASLGGKNTALAFEELKGSPFPPQGTSAGQAKAECIGTLKEVLGKNRRFITGPDGLKVDLTPTWGFLRASSKLRQLRKQLEVYKVNDKSLTQDRLMTVAMGVHYIEKRTPRISHKGAVNFNIMRGSI